MVDNGTLVVTRHAAYVEYLREIGLVSGEVEVREHVGPHDVAGRDVIGILPLYLAALAESVTTVPLNTPQELRSVELSLEQVRLYAGPATTYRVFTQKQFSRALAPSQAASTFYLRMPPHRWRE